MIIKPLPLWAIVNRFPSFYEGESLTAIEQTARLYGKVNELIETYNRFVTENNAELTELETQVQKDLACAVRTIINLTDSYITQVELRLGHQDRKLDEQYKALTDDITDTVDSLIRQMKEAGELDQVILDAVDNLNTKFENLQTGVSEEQAALRADYEAAKAAMEANYEDSLRNIDTYFAGQMDALNAHASDTFHRVEQDAEALNVELRASVDKNSYFREHTTQVLADITSGDGVGYGVPEIGEYSLVGVLLRNGAYCICPVEHHENGQYYVRGIGYGERFARYDSLYPILKISTVDMALNADGDIVGVTAGYIGWVCSASGVEMEKGEILISRIDGLVMNPNGIHF